MLRPSAPSAAARRSASCDPLIHWTTAPHDEHERRADRGDADLGAVARHALAEQQDHDERQRRDQRDSHAWSRKNIGVSPSARRRRRGRHCADCGR